MKKQKPIVTGKLITTEFESYHNGDLSYHDHEVLVVDGEVVVGSTRRETLYHEEIIRQKNNPKQHFITGGDRVVKERDLTNKEVKALVRKRIAYTKRIIAENKKRAKIVEKALRENVKKYEGML